MIFTRKFNWILTQILMWYWKTYAPNKEFIRIMEVRAFVTRTWVGFQFAYQITMKILQTYKKVLQIAFLEFEWTKSSFRSILPIIYICLCCVFLCCYLFFEDGTFQAYSEIFYLLATVGINTIISGYIYTKRSKLSAFINKVDHSIRKSKIPNYFHILYLFLPFVLGFVNPAARTIYVESNELIEKWFELFYFVLCKITPPCLITPYLVSCYYLYFVTDAKDEAFALPFLAWYKLTSINN